MKRFTQLFCELDETNRTNEKVLALRRYFEEAPPADAAWALFFLCGRTLPRVINSATLRSLVSAEAQVPPWLVDECYDAVGDLAETIALLLPDAESGVQLPLHEMVGRRLLPLPTLPEQTKRNLLAQTWRELNRQERLVWNKLVTGAFRVGVAQTLVIRALARVAHIEPAVMAHRVAGKWQPTATDFESLLRDDQADSDNSAVPYPFFLASPLEGESEALGDIAEWQAEWKWDGIRAQLIKRRDDVVLWSRGEEIVNAMFPEIIEAGYALPNGTVLDGEILAWRGDKPQPFGTLQRRLGRKQVSARMLSDFPVMFLAYDLLELQGNDCRHRPLSERRRDLESVVTAAQEHARRLASAKASNAFPHTPDLFASSQSESKASVSLRISETLSAASWNDLAALRAESRGRQVEGLMLKRRASPYGVGRQRGDWWKWKINPYLVDAVLMLAQPGSGKRASLFTDYTFGLWNSGQLVPIAKAYSGLTDAEIREVDTFVRGNTIEKFGPVRTVKPELVFELAFEDIQASSRHKAGIAVRFPRMNRWRKDKKAAEADSLETLRALLQAKR